MMDIKNKWKYLWIWMIDLYERIFVVFFQNIEAFWTVRRPLLCLVIATRNPTISIETVIKDDNIEYIPSIQIIKSVPIYYYILHSWQSHMRAASASLPFDTTEKFCRINRTHTQPNQLLLIFIIINKYFQRIFIKIIIIIKIIVI